MPYKRCPDCIRNDSRDCYSCDVEMEHNDQKDVQDSIKDAGKRKTVKRSLRISDGTQYGGTEVDVDGEKVMILRADDIYAVFAE